jgi:hypothetical protein
MTRYTFHFYRHGKREQFNQQVHVRAESPRDAWALFESIYPYKFFTCYGVSSS